MWLPLLCSILFSFAATAEVTVNARIHDIDYGQGNEDTFLLLTSGHVAWVKKTHNKSLAPNFEAVKNSHRWMKFTLNEKNELTSVKAAPAPVRAVAPLSSEAFTQPTPYTPTVIESLEAAKAIFKEGRKNQKESQCYNRAHIWSYEWAKEHEINSNKTWVFFTRRYIRKFTFGWWFHVAPSVAVKEGDVVREKIMDIKYANGPIPLKRWTDIFMRDDANCPKVNTYSEYANYPESGSCYTMRTSMFYYQPVDIENLENLGDERIDWHDADITQAYLEAFDEVY